MVRKERGAAVKGQVRDCDSHFHSLHRALFAVRAGSGQKKDNLEAAGRFQKSSSQSHLTYTKRRSHTDVEKEVILPPVPDQAKENL